MNTSNKPNQIYFPNLNGLRAIGAFIVMIGHIEFLKYFFGVPAFQWFPIPGKIGVTLFFALSGFLITSLLLQEREIKKTVHLRKFYWRRILRIWPLYYFIILLSICLFNRIEFLKMPVLSEAVYSELSWKNILILAFILPNFTHYNIPYADQRWSIVVEEQFYLIQPFLLKIFKTKRALAIIFIFLIFSSELFTGFINVFQLQNVLTQNIVDAIALQLEYLGCIAVGCLFSVLYFKRQFFLKSFFFRRYFQIGLIALLCVLLALGKYVFNTEELVDFRIYTFLFALVVLNASQNERSVFKLERPVFNFLGKISYGIYMYHPVCIGISIAVGAAITSNVILQNIIIYCLSVSLTVLVSWLSFNYFEGFFLSLKSRFEIIKPKRKAKLSKINQTELVTDN